MPMPAFLRHWRALRAAAAAVCWTPPPGIDRRLVSIDPAAGSVLVGMACGCAYAEATIRPPLGIVAMHRHLTDTARLLVSEHAKAHAEADRRAAREAAAAHAEWTPAAAWRAANFRDN